MCRGVFSFSGVCQGGWAAPRSHLLSFPRPWPSSRPPHHPSPTLVRLWTPRPHLLLLLLSGYSCRGWALRPPVTCEGLCHGGSGAAPTCPHSVTCSGTAPAPHQHGPSTPCGSWAACEAGLATCSPGSEQGATEAGQEHACPPQPCLSSLAAELATDHDHPHDWSPWRAPSRSGDLAVRETLHPPS